jgi:mono/diheme cytochrome c family protein
VRLRVATTALAAVLVAVAVSQQVSRAAGPAALDPEMLPQHLTETGLYAPGAPLVVASGVRQFLPQYPLWSDGLTKRRWVFLPKGASIDATSELAWEFPVGTRFWKEFSLNGRRVETRMSLKASPAEWLMASYVWNEQGTDAALAPPEGVPGVVEVSPGRVHSIPSRRDCTTCHGSPRTGPLGFNALQLSNDRDPNAIHGEPLGPAMLTLADLINQGTLTPAPMHFIANPPRIRSSSPATRSVLGYLAVNCVICHNGGGDGTPLGPSLAMRDLLEDADTAARSLLHRPSAWQVPGVADGHSVVVHPGSPDRSALFVRLRSRAPSSQMPPLGTAVRDQQAVDAIGRWISELAR